MGDCTSTVTSYYYCCFYLHYHTHTPSFLPFAAAGPHYLVTPLILDILKEKKVKATFFISGEVRG